MPTPPLSDELAREAVETWRAHDCRADLAAKALGLGYEAFKHRLAVGKSRGFHLPSGAQTAMQSVALDGSTIKGGWRHHYDADGKKLESVRWSTPDGEEGPDLLERIREVFEGLTPAAPVPIPKYAESDLLTIYKLADVHLGMMAWGKETGQDYSTSLAAERVKAWIGRCVAVSPSSRTAIILDVGDLTHSDDQTNQTPASKHNLDVDSRHFKTLDVTIEALNCAVELALAKHQKVIVRILPGNHNITAYMAVMFALAERYRDNPRVKVQKVPGEFFVHEFGQVMIAAHHGHRAKPDRLVHFLADEFAEIWGRTRHRFLWTGHLHHMKAQDIGGVQHEQLRAVTSRDAYAFSSAYTARAQLQAVTYHRTDGEISRVKVNG
jgi:hypothetical protein